MKGIKGFAKILNLKPIHENAILNRLKYICHAKGLVIDQNKLKNLAISCNMDIRSIINTLQVTQNLQSFDVCDPKNTQRSIFDIWSLVFTKRNFPELGNVVHQFGDYTKINEGIFENYPSAFTGDIDLDRSTELLDSLVFADEIDQRLMERQQYELGKFRKLPTLVTNQLSTVPYTELRFPLGDKNLFRETTETQRALKLLESESDRKAGKVSYTEQMTEVLSYSWLLFNPVIDRSKDEDGGQLLLESYLIFKEIGFQFVKNEIEPPTFRIIRGFQLDKRVFALYAKMSEGVAFARLALSALSIDSQPQTNQKKRKWNLLESGKIVFLHHEGLTNAVRRKLKVRDLFN